MPAIDLNNEPIQFSQDVLFDVVITGAGAAGILLAIELSKKGKKVLLLESGHFSEDEQRQELNTVEQTGKNLSNAVWGRKRAIGGTTIAWGGQSLPFSPLDFTIRDWVNNSGWPITYNDLHDYYTKANEFMKIDTKDYEDDILNLFGIKKPPFKDELLKYHFSKWAPQPNFKQLYWEQLKTSVTVVYNAVLTRINFDAAAGIESIEVSNFKQKVYVIKAHRLIIAAGGIETNRILLSNRHQTPSGIGNHSGWLGKCFMDHPCIKVGTVVTKHPYRLQSLFNTHVKGGRKYSIRISAAEGLQQQNRVLNGSASIMFDYPGESFDPYAEIRRFMQSRKIGSVKTLAGSANSYLFSAFAYVSGHFVYKHRANGSLVLMLEQEPIRDSYIGLSEKRDQFGIPQALINWKLNHKAWDTVMRMSTVLGEEISRLSLGQVKPEAYITKDNPDWESCLTDVNHHMGGARMSGAASNGVVDKDLQVWGHKNLYVCSAAVFPTASHSNPTLTVLALAYRLVNKIALEN
jgi:choline dehydrogenase-like flavoprotein